MRPTLITNKILASLPAGTNGLPLEAVTLQAGTVLYEPDEEIKHVYFLNGALVSIVAPSPDGGTIEIGLIGYEGMVGVPAILGGVSPYRAVVHMSGEAFRTSRREIHTEFRNNPVLRDQLLKYTNMFLIQVAQSSLCNCYHALQERLSRWLLVARDGARSDTLQITHELISRLLGTRRASVTVAAGLLQRAGLIKTGRGEIRILDREGLESMACECYSIVRYGVRNLQTS